MPYYNYYRFRLASHGKRHAPAGVLVRETDSWKWPLFQWLSMGILVWTLAFLTWHIGHLLEWH